jgi:hypothetical protein
MVILLIANHLSDFTVDKRYILYAASLVCLVDMPDAMADFKWLVATDKYSGSSFMNFINYMPAFIVY